MRWDAKFEEFSGTRVRLIRWWRKPGRIKQISEALFIIINSTRSHEVAYRILERKILGPTYSQLDKQETL